MTIAFNKYVSITSAVGVAESIFPQDLGLRIITNNTLSPPQSILTFTNSAAVGAYFGTSSEEYKRAAFYFAWISKNFTLPDTLSFARFVDTAVAPMIFGGSLTATLSTFTAISNGSFTLQMGLETHTLTGLDFSGAGSFAAIAADLQVAIRAIEVTDALWHTATVTYNSTANAFELVGGVTGTATISTTEGVTGTPVLALLGWGVGSGATLAYGAAVQSITDCLIAQDALSTNYGSFLFTYSCALILTEIEAASTWNVGNGVTYQYHVATSIVNASTWSPALIGNLGTGLTIQGPTGEFHEMDPTMILAATDYTKSNAVQNYMYQIFNQTPTVTNTTTANTLDALRVNYYGQTQLNGQPINFYQRGYLMGPATSPQDMNTYGNEQWLKSAASAALISLQLAANQIPANSQGVVQVLGALQNVIDLALFNGTFSVSKPLSPAQISYITTITGDPAAYSQVQNAGYWVSCVIVPFVDSASTTEFAAKYIIVYSKDDVVRFISGTQVLI